jgi:HK97 family phage portal protein
VTYAPIQVSPEDSQFLETHKWTVNRIASRFRVPPEFVGGETGDSMTYANVESRWLNLLATALAPRLARFEAAFTRLLPRPQYVKFNEHGLLRTDLKTQHEIVAGDIQAGILSPDEGRAVFDRPPIPGGAGAQFVTPGASPFPEPKADSDAE